MAESHSALGASNGIAVVQDELPADRALQAGAAQERGELLLERPVQRCDGHQRCSLGEIVRDGRETSASEGRRERS
jgi:hypothetical protein